VTLKRGQHSKYRSFAFTEQGVAMLSSVLNSNRAIQVNILIMRAFTKLREMLSTHEDLRNKIEAMEKKYDQQFQIVFEAIKQLLETEAKSTKKIGFTVKKHQEVYAKSSTTMGDLRQQTYQPPADTRCAAVVQIGRAHV